MKTNIFDKECLIDDWIATLAGWSWVMDVKVAIQSWIFIRSKKFEYKNLNENLLCWCLRSLIYGGYSRVNIRKAVSSWKSMKKVGNRYSSRVSFRIYYLEYVFYQEYYERFFLFLFFFFFFFGNKYNTLVSLQPNISLTTCLRIIVSHCCLILSLSLEEY